MCDVNWDSCVHNVKWQFCYATESSRKVFSSALRQNEGGTDFQRKEIYQPIIIFHSSLFRRGMFICLAIFIYKETQRFRRHVKEVTLKKRKSKTIHKSVQVTVCKVFTAGSQIAVKWVIFSMVVPTGQTCFSHPWENWKPFVLDCTANGHAWPACFCYSLHQICTRVFFPVCWRLSVHCWPQLSITGEKRLCLFTLKIDCKTLWKSPVQLKESKRLFLTEGYGAEVSCWGYVEFSSQ